MRAESRCGVTTWDIPPHIQPPPAVPSQPPVTHHHYIIKATSHCLPFPAFLFVQCLQPAIKQSKYLQKVQLNLLLIICFVFLHNVDHDLLDTETLLCSSIKRVVRALRLRYSSDLLTEFFVFFIWNPILHLRDKAGCVLVRCWRCDDASSPRVSQCVHLPPVLISRPSRPSCSPTCPASRTSPRDNCSGTTGQVWGLFVKTGPWESYLKHKHSLQLKSHQKVDILRLRSPHHRASESCKRYWENAVPILRDNKGSSWPCQTRTNCKVNIEISIIRPPRFELHLRQELLTKTRENILVDIRIITASASHLNPRLTDLK